MEYLSAEAILTIHGEIIELAHGIDGVRDAGLLEHILEKPKMIFAGQEVYRGVFRKAASYYESFARHQVFLDGNKRTAIAAAGRFLFLNGFIFEVSDLVSLEQFTLDIAAKKIEGDDIARWLEKHSRHVSRRVA